jgi:hypothetical protein
MTCSPVIFRSTTSLSSYEVEVEDDHIGKYVSANCTVFSYVECFVIYRCTTCHISLFRSVCYGQTDRQTEVCYLTTVTLQTLYNICDR